MVRIALLGDVHLALNKNSEFERNRFLELIKTISIKKYDVVIFTGDLLDKARPSLEELQLLQFSILNLNHLGVRTIVLDGNHEAVDKNSSTYDYVKLEGLEYLPNDSLEYEGVTINTLGYSNLIKYPLLKKSDILLSHFRSDFGIIKEEIDVKAISKKADLVILGDIHQRYSPYENVHYTGSPYSIHFTSQSHKYGYIELTIDSGSYKHEYVDLELPCKKIISITQDDLESALTNTKDLLRIKIQGTSKELECLPKQDNVTYITSLTISEQTTNIESTSIGITDIVGSLVSYLGEPSREVLTNIYKEIT